MIKINVAHPRKKMYKGYEEGIYEIKIEITKIMKKKVQHY